MVPAHDIDAAEANSAVPAVGKNSGRRRRGGTRANRDIRRGPRVPRVQPTDTGPGPDWADVLAAIGASFDWLCTRPHPVCVDGRSIAGLPDALIPLDELRSRVIARSCPLPVSDAVWAHLASRSRIDGGSWTVACAGMALPMLRRVVRSLTVRFAGDRADIAAETVTGFLAAVATIDVGGVALFASLRWAAYRAGLAAVRAALAAPTPLPHESPTIPTASTRAGGADGDGESDGCDVAGGWRGSFGSGPPPAVAGHPDLVLARAVADGILSLAEAALIGSTRLEALTLAEAAKARGQSLTAVTVARHRAEHRLRRYLTAVPPTSPDTGATTAGRATTAHSSPAQPTLEPTPEPATEPSAADMVADAAVAAAAVPVVTPSGRRRIRTRSGRPQRPGSGTTR